MVRPAEIFVGVLGASSYTYAEAVWTQTLPDWIGAHGRMFGFFGGVPRLVIPEYVSGHIFRLRAAHRYVAETVDHAAWRRFSAGEREHNFATPHGRNLHPFNMEWRLLCWSGTLSARIRSTAFGHPGSVSRSSGTSAG